MERESNAAVVTRYIEMWNTGNTQWADELLSPTWRDHAHPEVTTVQRVRDAISRIRTAFPDFHITIETIVCEGDLVALRAQIQAGRPSHVMWFVRVVGGKMQEMWTGTEAEPDQ